MGHTFFITGASSGLGQELSMAALKAGHKVIGTARNVEKARTSNPQFEAAGGEWAVLDVTQSDVPQYVEGLVRQKGIDIVVNNAAYALVGTIEGFSDEQIQAQFNTNVYGVARVLRGALPVFRERKAGTVVNIGSLLGFSNEASCSMYGATKYALMGMTEALAIEVASFNIRVILIEPGAFRTNFLADNALHRAALPPGYEGTSADQHLKLYTKLSGTQRGDPAKAAPKMVDIITLSGNAKDLGGIIRFPMGDDCHEEFERVAQRMQQDAEKTKKISKGTNHPDGTGHR